ncbi:hypothetical protein ACSFA0_16300 [Variovorax sp. LT1P1]|uniref:hypothetical protein n=1 Tax=Variovorax sp. LT1P1 TaxID=3443730 RepID=UPI003F47B443
MSKDELLLSTRLLSVSRTLVKTCTDTTVQVRSIDSIHTSKSGPEYIQWFALGAGLLISWKVSLVAGLALASVAATVIWYHWGRKDLFAWVGGESYTLISAEPEATVDEARAAIARAMALR